MSPPPLSPTKPHPRFSPKPALPARKPPSRPPSLPAKTGRRPHREDSEENSSSMMRSPSRSLVFKKASAVVTEVVQHIRESEELCLRDSGESSARDEEDYSRAKERLTNESRGFVTASKLFVKSATESEGQLLDCLGHCVQMMDRIGSLSREVVLSSPDPLRTRDLISKVRDVAEAYLATVEASAGGDDDPDMNTLMKRATSLASVLTTLMRSLRVFN